MISEEARFQISCIDRRLDQLRADKEEILQSQELTTKEHMEFYHG